VVRAQCAYLSMSATPIVLDLSAAYAAGAAATVAMASLDPEADIHASADYRRHLAGVLTDRALKSALLAADGAVARSAAKSEAVSP
jgi:carbon-monoxide dehydrogenase medium subunit